MKVVEDNYLRLVIVHRPWLFAAFFALFSLVFVAVGVAFILLAQSDGADTRGGLVMTALGLGSLVMTGLIARPIRLVLDRGTGLLSLTRYKLFGRYDGETDIEKIRRAVPAPRTEGQRGTTRFGIELRDPYNPIFIGLNTNDGTPERIAATVNAWLNRKS